MNYSTESSLKLFLIFVVHGDANSQFRILASESALCLNLGQETGVLDLPHLAILSKPTWSDLVVHLRVRESHGLK